MLYLDTKNGPLVLEIPPAVLGPMDDAWFRWVTDVGLTGPDKGAGGKYVLLPPGYTGEIPEGYFVARSRTFGNLLFFRTFLKDGDPKPGVDSVIKNLRVYSLSQAANPPEMKFINISGKAFNTIGPSDYSAFEYLNRVIQDEPRDAMDPDTLGVFAAIGIEKGKPFTPRPQRDHSRCNVGQDSTPQIGDLDRLHGGPTAKRLVAFLQCEVRRLRTWLDLQLAPPSRS